MKQVTALSFPGPQEMDRVEEPKWYVSFGGLTRILREELSGVLPALLPIAQKIILHRLRNERVLLFSETPERKHKQPLHS